MKKLVLTVAAIAIMQSANSIAGLSINWGTAAPVFRQDGTTALLSGGASTLFQLWFSSDATIGAAGTDGTSAGDVLLKQLMVDSSTADESAEFFADAFTDPTFTAGFVYMRIFGLGSSIGNTPVGTYYIDGATIATADITGVMFPQDLNLSGSGSPAASYTLNLQVVPEPATFAFFGLGGLMVALRRRFIA